MPHETTPVRVIDLHTMRSNLTRIRLFVNHNARLAKAEKIYLYQRIGEVEKLVNENLQTPMFNV